MRAHVFSSRILCGLGLLLPAVCGAVAAPLELTSPFLPASGAPTNAATTGGPIELHGYMVTPEGAKFSIYDPAKKSATWVKINETGYPFVVRSFKTVNSTDQVTVDYQGSTLTLALKQSKIASSTTGAAGFAGRGNVQVGRGGPVQPLPLPVPTAQDAARLQAAAADFQQRQALRQQTQAALQAAPPPVVAPAGGRGQRGGNGGNFQQQNGQQGNGGGRRNRGQ